MHLSINPHPHPPQEITRNVDSQSLAPSGEAPTLPSGGGEHVRLDGVYNEGNKSLSFTGYHRLTHFAQWAAEHGEERPYSHPTPTLLPPYSHPTPTLPPPYPHPTPTYPTLPHPTPTLPPPYPTRPQVESARSSSPDTPSGSAHSSSSSYQRWPT